MLRNFVPFLLVPATLAIPLPALIVHFTWTNPAPFTSSTLFLSSFPPAPNQEIAEFYSGGGGGGGDRGSEFPTSHTLYSQFPPPSLVVHASVCFFYCKILHNVANFISYFSRLPPPWVSHLPPSLVPPPVHFPPPLLLASCPPVPLHYSNSSKTFTAWACVPLLTTGFKKAELISLLPAQ